ncbi:MAG: DUF4347 domain-containing protein [Chromatiaceae bacterium]|nr:DUF4347 domain-containing protein [Chromatiaceae bacterium]
MKRAHEHMQMEAMEPRMLLSADLLGLAGLPGADNHEDDAPWEQFPLDPVELPDNCAEVDTPLPAPLDLSLFQGTDKDRHSMDADDSLLTLWHDAMRSDCTTELLFVDSRVPDHAELIEKIRHDHADSALQIYLLDAERDGVAQIGEVLADHRGIEALHILSHGNAGGLQLGSSWLNGGNVEDYSALFEQWSHSLAEEADLLLYGCDLAAGGEGKALVDAIAVLTGADVAASINPTGHAALGGDWELEYRVGGIESTSLAPQSAAVWQQLLATGDFFDDFDPAAYDGSDGSLAWSNSWQEVGESNGAGSGSVSISSFLGQQGLTIGKFAEAWRQADLSGSTEATLSFDWGVIDFEGDDIATVEVSTDGTTWHTLDSLTGTGDSSSLSSVQYDISAYIDSDTRIKFSGIALDNGNDFLFVDDVRILLSSDAAPSAVADSYSTTQDTPLTVNSGSSLLANDSDPQGDPLTAEVTDGPDNGVLTIAPSALGSQTNLTSSAETESQASWSPDGSKIAFSREVAGVEQVFVMNADGTGVTQLTSGVRNYQAAWSPDGSQLAITSLRYGNDDIVIIDAGDGSEIRRLTSDGNVDHTAAWSPDGSKIAFGSDRSGGNHDIWVTNADGSGTATRLTTAADVDRSPEWSADGSQIVFRSTRDGDTNIYVMDADGANQTRLTSDTASDMQPSWSPDGSRIVFVSDRVGANKDLFVMDADGGNQRSLGATAAVELEVDWSPDGTRLLFDSDGDIMVAGLRFDGIFTYTPDSGFSGIDSFSYLASDGSSRSTAVTVTIGVNHPPTLTSFSAAVDSTNEDTQVEISFADLAAQGDEVDADGSVAAFVVKSVSSGTLKIGADAGSAIAWAASTNDLINATHRAYWTPANDANGTLNAFTVVARDDLGADSGASVAAQVSVTALNDNPSGSGSLTTTNLNDNAGASAIFANLSVADVDSGESDLSLTITLTNASAGGISGGGFSETAPGSGIYQATGLSVTAANNALDNVTFTPTDNSGSGGSFATDISVTVNDQGGGGERSVLNATTLTVNRVNDDPSGSGSLTTTSLNDNAGASAIFANLSVADVDSGESDLSLTITLTNASAGGISGGGFSETAPGSGIYQATGLSVTAANNALDNATFTPTDNSGSGGSFATDISVTVNDQGGGGEQSVLNATTLTVNRVNDNPSGSGSLTTTSLNDNAGASAIFANLSVADVDSGESDLSLTITLTNASAGGISGGGFSETAPGSGIYQATGLSVTAANNALDNVTFTPTDNSGSGGSFATDISVTVNDQGGGGERSVLNATTLTVNRVNDNPSGSGSLTTTSLNDNAGASAIFANLSVADVDSGESDLSLTITLTNASAGGISGGGFSETAPGSGIYQATGLSVAAANNALDSVTFTPTDNSGSGGSFATDISVTVNDQGGGGERSVLNATAPPSTGSTTTRPAPAASDHQPERQRCASAIFANLSIADVDSERDLSLTIRLTGHAMSSAADGVTAAAASAEDRVSVTWPPDKRYRLDHSNVKPRRHWRRQRMVDQQCPG